jgi:hypothetical protein
VQDVKVYHHYFINNTIGAIVRGFADYFGNTFFERTQDIVIATYDKGVEHFRNRKNFAGEKMSPKYPFIVVDPQLDFEPDPQAGRFFWGYPQFMGTLAAQMITPPVYEDENVLIGPVLNRYKGRIDIIVWAGSVYQLIDYRMLAYQMFGGLDRPTYPTTINGYIVLPDEVISYNYSNRYTGSSYSLDWESNRAKVVLVKNINKNRMVYPFKIYPSLKLTDVGDGSEKYGGSGDELSNHRLNLSFEWECSIPVHLGLIATKHPDYSTKPMPNGLGGLLEKEVDMYMDMSVGYEFRIPFMNPETGEYDRHTNVSQYIFETYSSIDSTSATGRDVWSDTLVYKDRYNYTLTQADHDAIHDETEPLNFLVYLPMDCTDPYTLRVYGKYGPLIRDHHWKVVGNGIVEFLGWQMVNMQVGDNIWFAVYESDYQ